MMVRLNHYRRFSFARPRKISNSKFWLFMRFPDLFESVAHPPRREPRSKTSSDHRAEDFVVSAFFSVLLRKLFHHPGHKGRHGVGPLSFILDKFRRSLFLDRSGCIEDL